MKKRNSFLRLVLSTSLLASLLFSTAAYAADTTTKDITIGSSGQVEMVGMIEPTILSVTMPSFVPFNISNSLSTQNKVISPRVSMKNNSNIQVQIDVVHTKVDLNNLPGVSWSNSGIVGTNQIAIGLKQEESENIMPSTLSNAKWLQANQNQNMNVLILNANQEGAVYVVGTLGQDVSETGTFNVTPTFVVSKTNASQ